MPGLITRKARSSRAGPAAKSMAATTGIAKFTRVSKRSTLGKDVAEKIFAAQTQETTTTTTVVEIVVPPAPAPAVKTTSLSSSKKRKSSGNDDEDDVPAQSQDGKVPPRAAKRSCRQSLAPASEARQQQLPRTPTQTTKPSQPRSPTDVAAAQQAGALLERLNIQSPRRGGDARSSVVDSDAPLPQELVDLANLHAAFLKTVSIHYAHNGTNVPVDVKMICPTVAQAWGKRKVTLDDVCRSVALMGPVSPFYISDYGRAKICLELHSHVNTGRPLSEEQLNQAFDEALRRKWCARSTSDVRQFIAALPKALIKKSPSASAVPPALAKGQRTLDEFKHTLLLKKEAAKAAPAPAIATSESTAPAAKLPLLERIRLRQQQQQLSAATGPSAADLSRRAALQRADDVAAVIAMLSRATAGGQKRVSFSMPAVLTKLRDSLRLPVSREEAAACVRTLAAEVAPEWLRVVVVGGRENVVVMTDFAPSKAVVLERVGRLSGNKE